MTREREEAGDVLEHMLEWYDLTDREREIRDLALDVARREIAPRADAHDRDGTFVRDSIDALAAAGLLGVNIAERYGGMGGTPLAAVMAVEAVSAACGSTGASFMFHCNLAHVLGGAGPEELRQKYLPQMARGKLGAFAINERVRLFRDEFETTIEEHDDHFVLNGEKPFSTSAGEADVTIVQVQRPQGHGPFPVMNQEYVLVDKGTPGFTAEIYDPMGLRGASNGRIKLSNVKIPKENVVGDQPGRMIRAVVVKGNSALGPNVLSAGIAGAALEAAVRHVRKRGVEEWISHVLAPMSDELNALRCYNYYTARIMSGGFDDAMASAHIEIQRLGGKVGPSVCDRALEVMGGSSFMRTSPIQRYYRDARACAYLAFAMDERRLIAAEVLYGRAAEHENPDPPTMPWDPFAAYSHRMSSVAALDLPEQVRQAISRRAVEAYARSQGASQVDFELYMQHRRQVFANSPGGPPPAAGNGDRRGDSALAGEESPTASS